MCKTKKAVNKLFYLFRGEAMQNNLILCGKDRLLVKLQINAGNPLLFLMNCTNHTLPSYCRIYRIKEPVK